MNEVLAGLIVLLAEGLTLAAQDSQYREQILKTNAEVYAAIVASIRGDKEALKRAASEGERLALIGFAMCEADEAKEKDQLQ